MDLQARLDRLSPRQRARLARRLQAKAAPAGQRLVAYVVPEAGVGVDPEALRRFAAQSLPAHMVPEIAVLDAFPRLPNGKVDRQALPDPARSAAVGAETPAAPQDPLEQVLADIWAEILERNVGVHEDFFALGGHSLLATALIAQLRDTFQCEIPLRHLFDHPTVSRLAAAWRADANFGPKAEKTAALLLRIADLPEDQVEALLETPADKRP